MRRALAPLAPLLALLAAASARAEPAPAKLPAFARLEYLREPGAEQCAAASDVSAAVEARLRRRVFVDDARAGLTVRVQARRLGGRFVVETRLLGSQGEPLGTRRLETSARHCSALDDSLALVLALALDVQTAAPRVAEAVTAAAPSAPDIDSPPSSRSESLQTPLEIPSTTHAPRAPVELRAALGGALGLGLMPHVSVGAQALFELTPATFWPVALGVTLWHDQRLGGTRGAEFAARTLQLRVCPLGQSLGRWRVEGCAEQLLGRVDAAGFGFDRQPPEDRWLLALGVGGAARYELGPWFVGVRSSLLAPLVRRRYFYTEGDEVTLYQAPWALGLCAVSFGVGW